MGAFLREQLVEFDGDVPCRNSSEFWQAQDCFAEALGIGIAILWLERESSVDDGFEPWRNVWCHVAELGEVTFTNPLQDVEYRSIRVHASTSGAFPKHHAHTEEIGAMIQSARAHLLGRHVRDLALDDSALGLARLKRLRDSEIEQLAVSRIRHEHVLR